MTPLGASLGVRQVHLRTPPPPQPGPGSVHGLGQSADSRGQEVAPQTLGKSGGARGRAGEAAQTLVEKGHCAVFPAPPGPWDAPWQRPAGRPRSWGLRVPVSRSATVEVCAGKLRGSRSRRGPQREGGLPPRSEGPAHPGAPGSGCSPSRCRLEARLLAPVPARGLSALRQEAACGAGRQRPDLGEALPQDCLPGRAPGAPGPTSFSVRHGA